MLFSGSGSLLAVALADGAVLLSRVDHYMSGSRANAKLSVHDGATLKLKHADSYRLIPSTSQDGESPLEVALGSMQGVAQQGETLVYHMHSGFGFQ